MANTSKVIDLDRLARFKAKQDAANDAKFALKGEGGSIATADKAGIVKPGGDFDITEDGTISLYKAQDTASKGTTLSGVNLKASKTYTLKATDARNAVATRTADVAFRDKRHWWVAVSLDAAGVTDQIINQATGELATWYNKTFTLNAAAGQHIYYAFPASWGTPRFFVGGFEGGFALLKTFDHKNASGATISYAVWKSTNAGLGNTTVEVK